MFKEFGVRLRFTPTIMRNGNIRLKVAPEVSSLDFANALTFQGFVVPSLLTRRAETEVELQDGQHLSIAGLIDNATIKNVNKIPILGDLPILGFFFRSKSARERRTELLVILTPRIVGASDSMPPVPTGEPQDWGWSGWNSRCRATRPRRRSRRFYARRTAGKRRRQRGQPVLVAMAMITVGTVAALAIDLGMLYKARSDAQRAAESAALAGASAFVDFAASNPVDVRQRGGRARQVRGVQRDPESADHRGRGFHGRSSSRTARRCGCS